MPRQPSTPIVLDRRRAVSLQSQLAFGLKTLVQTAVLRPGTAVPSSRELARDLRVSRNTVIHAYDRLIGEGYFEASPRRGLFVNGNLASASLRKATPMPLRARPSKSLAAADSETIATPRPFSPCRPDIRLFPLALWNRLRTKALRSGGTDLLHYQPKLALGLPELRCSLAAYLRESRGVRCDWRQIAITAGSQQALFLLSLLLLKPGDRVAMEDPGYPGARLSWQRAGAFIQPLAIDAEGMKLPSDVSATKLAYTTPSRQFPTGVCMSLSRRLSLADWAARTKAWIVEDDYDSEFRYSRPPLPSLQSLDASSRVIYVGSMSKVLFPSLRIGYLVLPDLLVEPFAELRSIVDAHGPLIDQAALARFIETGAFGTHIRRSRREYGDRLATFLDSAAGLDLPLTFPNSDGGMNLAGFLNNDDHDLHLAKRLREAGLEVHALSEFVMQRSRPGLLFGFTAFEHATIRQSLKRVALALPGRTCAAAR